MSQFLEKLTKAERAFVAFTMGLFVVCGVLQVIFRYVLKVPLAWVEEIIIFSSIWSAYIGAAAAAGERKHIFISFLVNLFPKATQFALTMLSYVLWLVVCGGLTYTGMKMVATFAERQGVAAATQIPYAVVSAAVPLGMLLMLVHVVGLMIVDYESYKAGTFGELSTLEEEAEEIVAEMQEADAASLAAEKEEEVRK